MRTVEVLELQRHDFATPEGRDAAIRAMRQAQIVIYRGEVVKNRNGRITRRLSEMQAQERREGQRVY